MIRPIAFLSLVLLCPPITAMPVANLNCGNLRASDAFAPLIQKASFYGPGLDKLKPIDKFTGLSSQEKQRIRGVTGNVFCVGPDGKHGRSASAFLVGSNNQIMTAQHEFKDKSGKLYPGLSKCIFETQTIPAQRIELDLSDDDGKGLALGDGYPADPHYDFAIAKLKTPLAGAIPLPVDISGRQIADGTKVISVSADMAGLNNPRHRDPYVQECTILNSDHAGFQDTYFSDCDSMPGASGSIQMIRAPDGQLVVRAMDIRGGTPVREAYDFAKRQFTVSIGIAGPALDKIREVVPELGPGNGAISP